MLSTKKYAVIMVDVDSWQTQLAFYGYTDAKYNNDVYENSLPRLIDLFEKFKIKATFFIVGKHITVKSNRTLLKKLAEAGHELANHSMTHPQAFSALGYREKEREIKDCTMLLEDITCQKVKGFRAPNYDIDERTIDILIKHGFLYDASVFPTVLAFPVKWVHFVLSGMKKSHVMGKETLRLSPRLPYKPNIRYLYKKGNSNIIELPLTVTPFCRLPFYGTSVMAFGERYFDIAFGMVKKVPFINYTFHAFEMANKDSDDIDGRLFRHPGVKKPFNEKYNLCKMVLAKISENFHIITAKEHVERMNT